MITEAISLLLDRKDLPKATAEGSMREIMTGEASSVQTAAFLTALRMKKETPGEIAAFASVMRGSCERISPKAGSVLVDTCGTGGDAVKTFNVSTAAAFVAAGAGVPVAKHGNRSVTSKCGSADVLEVLGVNLNLTPAQVEKAIGDIGIGFMFAPRFHPAMKHALPVRKELGFRTVFNLLGPLTNPAGARAQLAGVYSEELVSVMCNAMKELGLERCMVVHSNGMDEISTLGPTKVCELKKGGEIISYAISPEDFKIAKPSLEELYAPDAKTSAVFIREVLGGQKGARRDIVLLNAAAAIYLSGRASSMKEGFKLAEKSIDSGSAVQKLETLINFGVNLDILDDFIQKAKENVQKGYYRTDRIAERPATGKSSLRAKLDSQDFSLIAEIKHASPSGDYEFREIDAEKMGCLFRDSGADAISCVVEPRVFRGKLENIPLAKKAGLPVLFKDFIFCDEQLEAARKLGADAVLLVVKVASRLRLNLDTLIESAHRKGLEVLLESYDESEMKTALGTKADILGINNRDLRTLKVDISRTVEILKKIGKLGRPVISESGIKTKADAEFVKNAGVKGILVGTALQTAGDIGEKIRELKNQGLKNRKLKNQEMDRLP